MIHTYKFIVPVDKEQLKRIKSHYKNEDFYNVAKFVESRMKGIKINLVMTNQQYFVKVNIDAIIALGSYQINEDDINVLLEIHEEICNYLCLDVEETLNHTRIDYRVDIRVEEKEQRELIFKLFNKAKCKYYKLEKEVVYDTTICLVNKSMEVKVYDKEKERRARNFFEPIKEEEKGIIRFEVALRNRHLKYNKKRNQLDKHISEYLNDELLQKYMKKFEEILFVGDFYYLLDAERILEEKGVPKNDRDYIHDFMVINSKYGFAEAQKRFTKYRVKKCLEILKRMNIHPVPIPKNIAIKGVEKGESLKNPVNCILDLN